MINVRMVNEGLRISLFWYFCFTSESKLEALVASGAEERSSVTGRRLSIPLLRYPIAEHLLLYGVGARPPPDGVR